MNVESGTGAGPSDPREVVKRGYDRVAAAHVDYVAPQEAVRRAWIADLVRRLPEGGRVLELGCGDGQVAAWLTPTLTVTGVDLSPVQIERGRRNAPGAELICGDMTALGFPSQSFDAIVALYSIIHVPLGEQPALFERMRDWLRPGGLLFAVLGADAWTGTEADWLDVSGATMYWSHADAATYRAWLEQLGFTILAEEFVPEGEGGHTRFLAQRAQPS